MPQLATPSGTLTLECHPKVKESIQRPWDAADLYLIEQAPHGAQPLVLNDQWGVLSTYLALNSVKTSSWIDSACGLAAASSNARHADVSPNFLSGQPTLPKDCDSLWIYCPKSFDQLHWWLSLACRQLEPNTQVQLAGMAKHIPIKWLNWLQQHCDDYQQHLIRKKARLISFKLPVKLPDLKVYKGYEGHDGQPTLGLPGVFSRDHMDIGSRRMIQALDDLTITITGRVVDLGCGNGLLSIECQRRFGDIHLTLCDDSSLALDSAQVNLSARHVEADYRHGDALSEIDFAPDWILCNPPFHNGNRISTAAASRMFRQSKQKLSPQGRLLVIANSHLPYAQELKRLFGNLQTLSRDDKFAVYLCQQSKG